MLNDYQLKTIRLLNIIHLLFYIILSTFLEKYSASSDHMKLKIKIAISDSIVIKWIKIKDDKNLMAMYRIN